jgi:hypothetical protein
VKQVEPRRERQRRKSAAQKRQTEQRKARMKWNPAKTDWADFNEALEKSGVLQFPLLFTPIG